MTTTPKLIFAAITLYLGVLLSGNANAWSHWTGLSPDAAADRIYEYCPFSDYSIDDDLTFTARGTGHTTGHIANLLIVNSGTESTEVTVPAGRVPSDGKHQEFIVPKPQTISVPAGGTVTVLVHGYCLNPDLPAPPAGTQLTPPDHWIPAPEQVNLTNEIITTTRRLIEEGDISTPLDPTTTADLLTQYSIWTSDPDRPLTPADLCDRFTREFLSVLDRPLDSLTPHEKEVLDYAIMQIIDGVSRIGQEVGIPMFTPPALPPEAARLTVAPPSSHPEITSTIKVTSTGRTTGHVADLTVTNTTDRPMTVSFGKGPVFIPGVDGQPLASEGIPDFTLAPGETKTTPIYGYCADIRVLPVPAGEPLPDPSQWIRPGGMGDPTPSEPNVVQVPTQTSLSLPAAVAILKDLADRTSSITTAPCPEVTLMPRAILPGMSTILPFPLDQDNHAGVAIPLLLNGLTETISTFDRLKSQGRINTRMSGDPDRERESVIQQAFWRLSSAVSPEPYRKKDYDTMSFAQVEKFTGRKVEDMPESEKEQYASSFDEFFEVFQLTGEESKFVTREPAKPEPAPTVTEALEDFDPGYLKPEAEGSGTETTPSDPDMIGDPTEPPVLIGANQCDCDTIASFKAELLIGFHEGEVLQFTSEMTPDPGRGRRTSSSTKTILEGTKEALAGTEIKINITDLTTKCGNCQNRPCQSINAKVTVIYSEVGPNNNSLNPRQSATVTQVGNGHEVRGTMPQGTKDVGFFITVSWDCNDNRCGKVPCDQKFLLKVKRRGQCACKETYVTPKVTHIPDANKRDKKEEEFTFIESEIEWAHKVAEKDVITVSIDKDYIKAECDGCEGNCVATDFRYKVFGENISDLPAKDAAEEEEYSGKKIKIVSTEKITGNIGDATISITVYHTCTNADCEPAKCEKTFTIRFKR